MTAARANMVFSVSGIVVLLLLKIVTAKLLESPTFSQPIPNTTVAVGREAILSCSVENLELYKVAWLRFDTQTILTIHHHTVSKNSRISITHSEMKTWYLHIKEVRESDKGWYMCQINTDPMKSQLGYLDVVVPPDIVDFQTSTDVIVDEGSNVTLHCAARGSPLPSITWKREDGSLIPKEGGSNTLNASGYILNLLKIKREHMGPYLCIASNGVPPSVSKRITVIVQFPPSIWIKYQLIGAYDGQQIVLECHSEAYPKSINYWSKDNGEIIPHNAKYVPEINEDGYRVHMKLTLLQLTAEEYGIYKCISKNSLGDMEGTINIYRIPNPNPKNNISLIRKKSSSTKINDVTYQIDSSENDKSGWHFFGNDYFGGTHKTTSGVFILMLCLCLHSYITDII